MLRDKQMLDIPNISNDSRRNDYLPNSEISKRIKSEIKRVFTIS